MTATTDVEMMRRFEYQKWANTPKNEAILMIDEFFDLVSKDSRVKNVSIDDNQETLTIEADEIEKGSYSIGRIAGDLYESVSERRVRMAEQNKILPDVVNIDVDLSLKCKTRYLPNTTRSKILAYAGTLPPSASKAQCINIYHYRLNGHSIAGKLLSDHRTMDGALRAAMLFVDAGAANRRGHMEHTFGTIEFEDGSTIN